MDSFASCGFLGSQGNRRTAYCQWRLCECEGQGGKNSFVSCGSLGHKNTTALLIAAGADVNAKDDKGRTPLDRAVGYTETADLLRKHGGKTAEELKAEGK